MAHQTIVVFLFALVALQPLRAETSTCPDGAWEECRRELMASDPRESEFLAGLLGRALGRVLALHDDAYLQGALIRTKLVRNSYAPIFFQTQTVHRSDDDEHVIRTSAETLSTLAKINIAARLAQSEEVGVDWLAEYFLYLRKNVGNAPRVDPLRALGLIDSVGPIGQLPSSADAIAGGLDDTYAMLVFLVAHELYHVKHGFRCYEGRAKCLSLKRQDEKEADMYAIETLTHINEDNSYYAALPSQVFARLAIVLGEKDVPATHPHYIDRVRMSANALSDWIEKSATPRVQESLSLQIDLVNSVVNRVDREGVPMYFSGLDEEAASVELDDLRKFRRN